MKTFGGINPLYAGFSDAAVLLQSFPYDGTSTWGKGADLGFQAFLHAAENMELFDIETNFEVYKEGIHILPEEKLDGQADDVQQFIFEQTDQLLGTKKFLTFFGGEHSISIGIIKAFLEHYSSLSILQLDAHTDLRPEYLGSPFNHACALYETSKNANLVQVGIRSMADSEKEHVNREKCFLMSDIRFDPTWIEKSVSLLSDDVYITLDLDVLDPSIMPSTGTPEPGGMLWDETIQYLKTVFAKKNVVGFDLVELCPIPGLKAPDFLAAKLYYKMLSYKFSSR